MPIRKTLSGGHVRVKIWTDDIEPEAERQVRQLESLPFVFHHVAVMPDVHAGRGSAVGTVTASSTCVIPAAVGVDIGCGMAAVLTPFFASHLEG
jgi:tRNA-splicing ligase RtcB